MTVRGSPDLRPVVVSATTGMLPAVQPRRPKLTFNKVLWNTFIDFINRSLAIRPPYRWLPDVRAAAAAACQNRGVPKVADDELWIPASGLLRERVTVACVVFGGTYAIIFLGAANSARSVGFRLLGTAVLITSVTLLARLYWKPEVGLRLSRQGIVSCGVFLYRRASWDDVASVAYRKGRTWDGDLVVIRVRPVMHRWEIRAPTLRHGAHSEVSTYLREIGRHELVVAQPSV
jgi:hypothetical protein